MIQGTKTMKAITTGRNQDNILERPGGVLTN